MNSEVTWTDRNMLANGQDMSGRQNQVHQITNVGGPRSQDDAMVAYFFQRSPNEVEHYTSKRWAAGDDSVILQVYLNVWCFSCSLHSYILSLSFLFVSFECFLSVYLLLYMNSCTYCQRGMVSI